jgi:hypothetical protein
LDCRDVVGVVGPAIEKGFTRSNNLSAWQESGLCRFGETPKYAAHIQATKGKTVKKNTINYEVLEWGKPIHPQMMNQIGKGNRLTSGKVCGVPMTDENNLKLFEALDEEKITITKGKAAVARAKKKKALPGDDLLIAAHEKLKLETMKVKLGYAQARQLAGTSTPSDETLFKSRLVKVYLAKQGVPAAGEVPQTATAPAKEAAPKKRKRKSATQADGDEYISKAKDPKCAKSSSSKASKANAKEPAVPEEEFSVEEIRGGPGDMEQDDDAVPADVRKLNAALWDSDQEEPGGHVTDSSGDEGAGASAPLQKSGTVTLEGTWEADSIRSGPNAKGKFLVHWEDYGSDEDTWEPRENLSAKMVEDYLKWRFEDSSDSG